MPPLKGLVAAALLCPCASLGATADEPEAYPSQQTEPPKARVSPPRGELERRERARSYSSLDDPNLGLALELTVGLMLQRLCQLSGQVAHVSLAVVQSQSVGS